MNPEKMADAGAAGAAVSASISWATANEVVQLIAGIVAIAAGLASIYYYIRKARSK